MHAMRGAGREAAEDIFFGQIVIIWARWFVVLAVTVLTLWTSTSSNQLAGRILPIVGLVAMNFFLHGRILMELPANQRLVMAASLVDLLLITGIVLTWDETGLMSPFFVLYYPVIFAFALVFLPRITAAWTTVALVAYAASCLIADSSFVGEPELLKQLVMRIITLSAMGGLGTYYWRIQRDRRRHVAAGRGTRLASHLTSLAIDDQPTGLTALGR